MNNLSDAFRRYISDNGLVAPGDRILLTVSGGVDSMVMLALFMRCGYRVGVAHCNFQLRGAESDEDEELVAREAAKYGVPCYNRRFETAAEMERTGESMEMAARRLRYAWFDELCRTEGYDAIAVAHHADDSIETFFINLAQHIPFREDSSNRSTKYLRNKIRLGLIPRIREINPKFTALMRRNLGRLADAQRFIDRGIGCIRAAAVTSEGGIDMIHPDRIDAAFPRSFVIYELLSSAYGFKGDVTDAICRALGEGATGRRFYARERVAVIDRGTIVVAPIADGDDCRVTVDEGAARSYCGNAVLYYEYCDIDTIRNFGVPEHIAQVDADKLHYPLTLRRWREGDWFVPFGMTGRKKVSDFLIDCKLSLAEKQRQFVLLSGDEIVWLVGRRIVDRYRLTSETENVLRITKEIV